MAEIFLLPRFLGNFFIQICAALFANENEDAGGDRYKVEQEDGWPKIQAEP